MPAGLDTAHRTAARVVGIRSPHRGVDTLGPDHAPDSPASGVGRPAGAGAAAAALAPVVHLADRAPRPARDGAVRHGQTATVDAQSRVNLGKALTALGWTQQTFLVAARGNGASSSAPRRTARR